MASIEDYGFTENGYKALSLDESETLLTERLQNGDNRVDLGQQSFLSMILSIFADILRQIVDKIGSLLSMNRIEEATGNYLDGLVAMKGITRIEQSNSFVDNVFCGDNNTTIPSGSLFLNSKTNDVFYNSTDIVIINTNCTKIILNVEAGAEGDQYTVEIAGTKIEYVATTEDNEQTISNELKQLLIANAKISNVVDAEVNEDNELIISAKYTLNSFVVEVSTNIVIKKVHSVGRLVAQEKGQIDCGAGRITVMKSAITGLDETYNPTGGSVGVDRETDAELRNRFFLPVNSNNGSIKSIEAALLNPEKITGVTYCKVYNTKIGEMQYMDETYEVVAIEAVLIGGEDDKIAQLIQDMKAPNSYTTGNSMAIAYDGNQTARQIRFTRPQAMYIWIKIRAVDIDKELEDALIKNIQEAIVNDYATTLTIASNINILYIQNAILNKIANLGTLEIQTAATENQTDTPEYSQEIIKMGARNYPVIDAERITILNSNTDE